jgi:C4-dicarboxylate-specific signal transduction histidine kinase
MSFQDFTPEWLARANRLATVAAVLSTTVHEANNALQIISGSAEMLGGATASDVVARRSSAIGTQARRASALLAELSAFAKEDSGEGGVQNRVDAAQVAQRALAMRQYTLARLSIQSTFEGSEALPPVAARPRPILQIVLNLLLNAERALTGRDGGKIAVTAASCHGRVCLTVDDNGPGVPVSARDHLFELRTSLTGPTGPAGDGLGIGLPVSKWLAEREGGTLALAESALGGCAVSLSLRGS